MDNLTESQDNVFPPGEEITVLVVDDELSNLASLQKIFQKEGMRVLYLSTLAFGAICVGASLAMIRIKSALDVWWELAGIFAELREAGINVQEMENIVFQDAAAACARIAVDRAPSAEQLERILRSDAIFALDVVSRESTK